MRLVKLKSKLKLVRDFIWEKKRQSSGGVVEKEREKKEEENHEPNTMV